MGDISSLYPKFFLPDNSEYNSYSYCVPNPADNNFDIHLLSNIQGSVNLKISDILGNILYFSIVNKKSDELIIPVNNACLTNGIYFYQLFVDNNYISKGLIQIIR